MRAACDGLDPAQLGDDGGGRGVEVDEAAVVVVAGEVGATDPQLVGEQRVVRGEGPGLLPALPPGHGAGDGGVGPGGRGRLPDRGVPAVDLRRGAR